MTTATCYIVGAAPTQLPALNLRPCDLLIAADGGLETCLRAHLTPHRIVGDFDSLGHIPQGEHVTTLPVAKDETDTAYALSLARELGFRRFVIFGALGGARMDHSFANFALAAAVAAAGERCYLVGEGVIVTAICNDSCRFPATCRGDLSVFPFGGAAHGVTETGLRYTLDHADLAPNCALGVSNSFLGREAVVRVEEGTLLLFYSGGATELY